MTLGPQHDGQNRKPTKRSVSQRRVSGHRPPDAAQHPCLQSAPDNEGYDLICIHPKPRQSTCAIRVQVKSRHTTNCDRGFPVKSPTFDAFDFLVIAFLNIGWFYTNKPVLEGYHEPEFYTPPVPDTYQNERDFAQIAGVLAIPYPSR